MKSIIFILLFIVSISVTAQLDARSVLKLHNVSEVEMNAIVTPIVGSLIFNNTDDGIYKYVNVTDGWTRIDNQSSLKAIVLKTLDATRVLTADDSYVNFPIGSGDVLLNDSDVFNVINDGSIQVLEDGVYFMSVSLSVAGGTLGVGLPDEEGIKYILAPFINGNTSPFLGFFTRGYVDSPEDDSFWGVSGVIMHDFSANDIIHFRYRFELANDTTFNSWIINIGMTKVR